jgi:cold shock CspA family protein
MRFDGKLDKWNDDRGFGFIAPLRGGDAVFVHISAFQSDGRRPRLGELLSFEVEPAADGKRRAVNVQRPGRSGLKPAGASGAPWRKRSGPSRLPSLVIAVALAAVGAYAYTKYTRVAERVAAPIEAPSSSVTQRPESAITSFRCDGRQHCSQMTSCEEAKFFLKNCPAVKMDGDGDGIPCEQQGCKGPFGR